MSSIVSKRFLRSSNVTRFVKETLCVTFIIWIELPVTNIVSVRTHPLSVIKRNFPMTAGLFNTSLFLTGQPVRFSVSREGAIRPSSSVTRFMMMLSHCRYLRCSKGCPLKEATVLLSTCAGKKKSSYLMLVIIKQQLSTNLEMLFTYLQPK